MRHTINNMEESLAVKSSRKGHFLYNSALSQSCASSPSLPSCALSGGQNCLSLCSSFQLLLRCWPTSWPTATDTQHEYTSHPFLVPLHRFCCAPVTEKEELPLNKIEVKKMLVCNPGSCPIHLLFLHTHTLTHVPLSLYLSLFILLSSVFPVLTDLQPPPSLTLSLFIAPVETIETCPTCSRKVAQPHYLCGILGNAVILPQSISSTPTDPQISVETRRTLFL